MGSLHVRHLEGYEGGPLGPAESMNAWPEEGGSSLFGDPFDEEYLPGIDDPNDEDYDDEAERRPAYRRPTKQQIVFFLLLSAYITRLHFLR